MKLSNLHQYMILCEDAQMKNFLCSFLRCQGIRSHKITTAPIPAGSGCGEAYVRNELPRELELLRRNRHLRKTLVVCTDADKYSYDERKKMLQDAVHEMYPDSDMDDEMMLLWIPKREIETWIAHFAGEEVDENMEFRHGGQPISCKEEARKMSFFLQNDMNENSVLPSLIQAKKEYVRICKKQESKENSKITHERR